MKRLNKKVTDLYWKTTNRLKSKRECKNKPKQGLMTKGIPKMLSLIKTM